ncbi:hypothetical protein [Pinibacter soli]|uniref:Lipoprotein n=1 Tax=Pinibacter soli TaxID=3044211 RepID=A0ABT6RBE1_9BACT|nr:hypothetical protein [Pinibacter soli]MDI3319880.1 hypothetical protein [Pinibacter soli]
MKFSFYTLTLFTTIALLFFSCTTTKNINLSKREIKKLKPIYVGYIIGKIPMDFKWSFLEKNICQYNEVILLRSRTYTGTWSEKNDTIRACFFISKAMNENYIFYLDRKSKTLKELNNEKIIREYSLQLPSN